ncbi:hypothetical protein DSO57_1003027 [Entomophthora muscae]|uniref:Uncharacterized protein n=1 Tax=Entomophthora muscae TaxID=34485 RepID=A0ACC2SXK9_9FUNG|nr:hypothetical protein DSO57_1003027 [Entomophthora muscae]
MYGSALATIPSPWLCKVTSLYAQYYIYKGQLHTFLKDLHDQYGPIVHFTPNQVSVISEQSVNKLYKTYKFKKSAFYKAFEYGGDNIFSVS